MVGSMKMLSRKDIFDKKDIETEKVEVPEWGGHVYVRTLSGTERDEWEYKSFIEGKEDEFSTDGQVDRKALIRTNMRNIRATLVEVCAVDENGNNIFSPGDAIELGKKSAVALDRIFTVAQKLNKLRPEDLENTAKNSLKGQSEDSTLD